MFLALVGSEPLLGWSAEERAGVEHLFLLVGEVSLGEVDVVVELRQEVLGLLAVAVVQVGLGDLDFGCWYREGCRYRGRSGCDACLRLRWLSKRVDPLSELPVFLILIPDLGLKLTKLGLRVSNNLE